MAYDQQLADALKEIERLRARALEMRQLLYERGLLFDQSGNGNHMTHTAAQ
jgi:hypothetical protein